MRAGSRGTRLPKLTKRYLSWPHERFFSSLVFDTVATARFQLGTLNEANRGGGGGIRAAAAARDEAADGRRRCVPQPHRCGPTSHRGLRLRPHGPRQGTALRRSRGERCCCSSAARQPSQGAAAARRSARVAHAAVARPRPLPLLLPQEARGARTGGATGAAGVRRTRGRGVRRVRRCRARAGRWGSALAAVEGTWAAQLSASQAKQTLLA